MPTTTRAQRLADDTLQTLTDQVQDVQGQAAPTLLRVAEQADALLERGVEAVREGTQQLRESARRASDRSVDYVRDEPVKAVLIAAASGAALLALAQWIGRSRRAR